ncbi:4-hydroxybenzoate 3-monooxygenase [Streptomyces sp. MP131-18]|uniref:4-hydroxybenzoate 3-monooxygenase n=1 Tax=Streptomyces sp. MP131-18 TaxID=1857892 RepID=UPI00097CBA8B|nr:4-hydroxybenzoate 3-monooxygenase [Streptomyces sp. MP131-18]ONK12670.1 p-hydroxybenzoate hydroxylase [Streptomyces sp. MP131-18]
MRRLRTQVAIIGAGPAGLVLANLLTRAGVECLVVERRSRAYVESRARAGLIEHRTVAALRRHGLADGLLAAGARHTWCDFLCLGRTYRVDYGAHSGGRAHLVYPQQLLVRDLIAELTARGGAPLFSTAVAAMPDVTADRPRLAATGASGPVEIDCEHIVGCDGHRGVSRTALPATARVTTRRYPYDWLTVLAEVDRPAEGIVYGISADGFAGMMPRTAHLSRFYLQCPPGEKPQAWPARRIHAELRARLAPAGLPRIGGFPEVRVLGMHSSVTEPVRHGRLLLAGDAAHVVTPSGAKGMNLAIADAVDLADALIRHHLGRDPAPLAGHGARRLPEIWRVQEFSDRLLRLLHLSADEAADPRFALSLRRAALERLSAPGPDAAAFAHSYAGSGVEGNAGGRPD